MKKGLAISVLAFLGLVAGSSVERKSPKVSPPKPEPKAGKPTTSTHGWSTAAMPQYYGFRKRPCEAINKHGERVDISVKNALKKGMKIVNIPGVELKS